MEEYIFFLRNLGGEDTLSPTYLSTSEKIYISYITMKRKTYKANRAKCKQLLNLILDKSM